MTVLLFAFYVNDQNLLSFPVVAYASTKYGILMDIFVIFSILKIEMTQDMEAPPWNIATKLM